MADSVGFVSPRYDTITFMSDYGLVDEFVGVVHSVIRSIAPEVHIVDLTHQIPAHDVRAGGLALGRATSYLCAGVVLAVVDPGVGTSRRAVAVEVGDGASVLVGPDNGLLAAAVAMCGGATRAVELTNVDYQIPSPGPTFAGRDIFAPAAAHLCNGVDMEELGNLIDPVTLLPWLLPVAHREDGAQVCEVLWVDSFGNAQLNIERSAIVDMGEVVRLSFGETSRSAFVVENYDELKAGAVGLMTDSYGLISVVVDRSSAATSLDLEEGMEVRIEEITATRDPQTGVATTVHIKGPLTTDAPVPVPGERSGEQLGERPGEQFDSGDGPPAEALDGPVDAKDGLESGQ